MYLHEDKDNFKNIIEETADYLGKTTAVIEKDYYVTNDDNELGKDTK